MKYHTTYAYYGSRETEYILEPGDTKEMAKEKAEKILANSFGGGSYWFATDYKDTFLVVKTYTD